MANRGGFTNKLGFILAAAGSAVGLGNIWKFPYEVGNGGGAAFVVLYLLFCFILCFPVMVTEIAIGRRMQKNPVGAIRGLGFPRWKFLGLMGILAGVLILSFYNVIAGWAFGYIFEILGGNYITTGAGLGEFTSDLIKVGSYSIVFMVATAFVVIRGISGGIEKIARILMPALIIMILCIVIYGFTLENSLEGVSFYLVPDFSKFNLSTITGALRQAFFSLSLGMGALVTYGSYVSKRDNIVTSAAWITLTDVGIAFIAGLMIFPLVSFNTGGDMSAEVLEKLNGPGLIFVTLPGVFDNIPGEIGMYVGAFFFLLLSFAALTSTVSLLEVPVAYVVDEFQIRRKKAVVIIAVLIFVVGLPSLLGNGYSEFFSTYFVIPFGSADPGSSDFLSMIAAICDTLLLLGGCLIAVFAAYVWKTGNLNEEISKGFDGFEGSMAQSLINVGVTVVCPLVLFALFILVLYESFLAGLF